MNNINNKMDNKLNVLWFGDIGRRNSFSRISESVIPFLAKKCQVTVLAPPEHQILDPFYCENTEVVNIGDSAQIGIKYDDFKKMVPDAPEDQLMMKYSLLQAGFLCDNKKIDVLVFLGGNFVIEWFMRLINQRRTCIPSKIVVWTPFEYIPSDSIIENIIKADYLVTTNPIMAGILGHHKPVEWVHHGISPTFRKIKRKEAVHNLNKIRESFYLCVNKFNKNDKIILNANNFIPRKRLDLTMDLCVKIWDDPLVVIKPKLWLHTNTKDPKFKGFINVYKKFLDMGLVIITRNNTSEETLNNIYNMCDIGLQTSTGEGWSLTNCEHELTGAIQIVPDFLATKFNFSDSGLLIPVTLETENNNTVGIIDKTEGENILKKCVINRLERKESINKYTWESAALKLLEILEKCR